MLYALRLHKRIYYGRHCLCVENLLLNGCSKSFKNHLLFWGKWNIKYGESISCSFSYIYLFLILKLLVYFMFHLCSSLFTMFESTKLIYLRQCIFIHLYFYFCTFFGEEGVFFLLFFIVFVRFLWSSIVVTTDGSLFVFQSSDDLPVWPSTCELVQNLLVDQPISALLWSQDSILSNMSILNIYPNPFAKTLISSCW